MKIECPENYKKYSIDELLKAKKIVYSKSNPAYINTIFPISTKLNLPPKFSKNTIITQIDTELFNDFIILDKIKQTVYSKNNTKRKLIQCKEFGDINNSYKRYNYINAPINYNKDASEFINLDNVKKTLFPIDINTELSFANDIPQPINTKLNNLPPIRSIKNKFSRFNDKTTIIYILKWAKEQGINYIYSINEYRPYIFNKTYTTGFVYYTVTGSDVDLETPTINTKTININNNVNTANVPFIIQINTTNPGISNSNQFQLSGANGNYNIIANKIGGISESFNNLSGTQTLTFSQGDGIYDIYVYPDINNPFNQIKFKNGDNNKVIDIKQWGLIQWSTMNNAFWGCNITTISATDKPDLSNVTDMSYMFSSCLNFNPLNSNINNWNVSTVTNMSYMFSSCSNFNQLLNNWDVSHVTDMSSMFDSCREFNQPLNNWNVSNVTDMNYMFFGCDKFDQNIDNWDVSNVTNMRYMFSETLEFNQSLNSWEVSNVVNMEYMFSDNSVFNGDISNWDVSSVTNMSNMFLSNINFNQSLNNWNVSNVIDMSGMFSGCSNFNQSLNNWNVSSVTDMSGMFSGCSNFNQSLNNWNVSSVTDMSGMFSGCSNFNQPIDWASSITGTINLNKKTQFISNSGVTLLKLECVNINIGASNNDYTNSPLNVLILQNMGEDINISNAINLLGTAIDSLANSVATVTVSQTIKMTTTQKNSCNTSLWLGKGWTIIT